MRWKLFLKLLLNHNKSKDQEDCKTPLKEGSRGFMNSVWQISLVGKHKRVGWCAWDCTVSTGSLGWAFLIIFFCEYAPHSRDNINSVDGGPNTEVIRIGVCRIVGDASNDAQGLKKLENKGFRTWYAIGMQC